MRPHTLAIAIMTTAQAILRKDIRNTLLNKNNGFVYSVDSIAFVFTDHL
jgi:hypothetical protein